jgi:hypothetical protein
MAKGEAFARPPVAPNRVALQNEAIGDIGSRSEIRAILHDRAQGHGHVPNYLPYYHRSPQRAAVGDPRTSRGVPSFSLRSPQTELPFVIDIAYWQIVLKNSVLKPTVIADSFRPVGAGDRIDDGSAAS